MAEQTAAIDCKPFSVICPTTCWTIFEHASLELDGRSHFSLPSVSTSPTSLDDAWTGLKRTELSLAVGFSRPGTSEG